MKRLTVILVLLFCLNSFAEISLGVNLQTFFNNSHIDEIQERTTRDFNFSIVPSLIIVPSDRLEIVPFIGYSSSNSWEYDADGDKISESSLSGVYMGAGLFFRLFKVKPIRFSFGPQVHFTPFWNDFFREYNFGVSAPVNIDLLFSDAFFVRMSASIISIYLGITDYDDNYDRGKTSFSTAISTQVTPSMGFFFTF